MVLMRPQRATPDHPKTITIDMIDSEGSRHTLTLTADGTTVTAAWDGEHLMRINQGRLMRWFLSPMGTFPHDRESPLVQFSASQRALGGRMISCLAVSVKDRIDRWPLPDEIDLALVRDI